MWRKVLIPMMLILSPQAFSHTYVARVDESVWHLEPSPLQCRLWQTVPNYGEAVFEARAGETQQFYVDLYRPAPRQGTAEISVTAPEWRGDLAPRAIGSIDFKSGKRPIQLAEDLASQMLAELQVGMTPSFTHPGWYSSESVTMGVSAVNFQTAFRDYTQCVAGLFPASYNDLRHSSLHFGSDRHKVEGKVRERLDLIARYVMLDPEIRQVHVDGYTDPVGRRGHNWELSRLRAKAVKDYLEDQGLSPSMIVMDYHGEGKPQKRYAPPKPSLAKRRVTVSMVK